MVSDTVRGPDRYIRGVLSITPETFDAIAVVHQILGRFRLNYLGLKLAAPFDKAEDDVLLR